MQRLEDYRQKVRQSRWFIFQQSLRTFFKRFKDSDMPTQTSLPMPPFHTGLLTNKRKRKGQSLVNGHGEGRQQSRCGDLYSTAITYCKCRPNLREWMQKCNKTQRGKLVSKVNTTYQNKTSKTLTNKGRKQGSTLLLQQAEALSSLQQPWIT